MLRFGLYDQEGFELPSEEQLRRMVTPEDVCSFEATQVRYILWCKSVNGDQILTPQISWRFARRLVCSLPKGELSASVALEEAPVELVATHVEARSLDLP